MKLSFDSSAQPHIAQTMAKFPWKLFLLIGIGVPFIFVMVGAGMLYWDFYRSQNWMDAPGEITFSEVTSYQSDGSTMYTPDIRYSYQLGTETYYGAVNLTSSSFESWASDTVQGYPIGKSVIVKVSPEDFMKSYLPISDLFLPLFFVIFGGFMLVLFASVGIWGLRKSQHRDLHSSSSEIPGVTT